MCLVIFRILYLDEDTEKLLWQPHVYIYDLKKFSAKSSINEDKIHYFKYEQENNGNVSLTSTSRFEVNFLE